MTNTKKVSTFKKQLDTATPVKNCAQLSPEELECVRIQLHSQH